MSTYVPPSFKIFDSISTFLKDGTGNYYKSNSFTEVIATNRAWIIGEPGVGKSRLLQEIKREAESNNAQAIIIPLNKIGDPSIERYVKQQFPYFKLSKSTNVVCLDALDEVSANDFYLVTQKIEIFKKKFSQISLYITCREHYLKKEFNLLSQFEDFKCIFISPLNDFLVRKFLRENLISDDIEQIIESLDDKTRTNNSTSVFHIPRYLSELIKIYSQKGYTLDNLKQMKRADFFEGFIYFKLEDELKKNESSDEEEVKDSSSLKQKNEIHITKRVLEKLALIMEIYQVNSITKEELITYLDENISNINLLFLNYTDIDTFITRVLKSTDDIIEFDNTEFQEYLAAKELRRIGEKDQVLFDLIVNENTNNISPGWFDVLRYVVEIDGTAMLPIVDYISQLNKRYLSEEQYFLLLKNLDPSVLSQEQMDYIFSTIFDYFQRTNQYIYYQNAEILSRFYTASNISYISLDFKTRLTSIQKCNQIVIIGYLVKHNLVSQQYQNKAKAKLKLLCTKRTEKNILYAILNSLQWYSDLGIFKKLENKVINIGDEDITDCYVDCCKNVNPNDKFSIDLFLKHNGEQIGSWNFRFNEINTKEGFLILFELLSKSSDYLIKFTNKYKDYKLGNYNPFIDNLEKIWCNEIEKVVYDTTKRIVLVEKYVDKIDLLNDFIKLLISSNKKYKFSISKIACNKNHFWDYYLILQNIIDLNDLDKLYNTCKTTKNGNHVLIRFLQHSKSDKPAIYEAGRKYFSSEYSNWEAHALLLEQEKEKDKMDKTYENFKKYLEPSPGYFDYKLFDQYLENKEHINKKATENEIKRLKELVSNLIKSTDPSTVTVTVTKTGPSSHTINYSNRNILYFDRFIKIADALKMVKLAKDNRKRYIQYTLFTHNKDIVEYILGLLGKITKKDINALSEIIKDRTDDLFSHFWEGLFHIISTTKNILFKDQLMLIFRNGDIENYQKEEILKIIGDTYQDQLILDQIFTEFETDTIDYKFAEIANDYKIKYFHDIKAIDWRFKRIKAKKLSIIRKFKRGTHAYSAFESELDRPQFFNSIIELSDQSLIPQINDLLIWSFTLRNDEEYLEYSNYIQKNVYAYYLKLKGKVTFHCLRELQNILDRNSNLKSDSFAKLLYQLEHAYAEILSKPKGISHCIKKYNDIKQSKYLSIYDVQDLRLMLLEIVDVELKNIVQNEGFYKLASKVKNKDQDRVSEDTIQKTLKFALENALLKRGIRGVDIFREPQLLDNKRIDILVKYGFIGPIIIEIKLLDNDEIQVVGKMKAYKDKLKQYILGTNSKFGIYLILNLKDNPNHLQMFDKMVTEYQPLRKLLDIRLLNSITK